MAPDITDRTWLAARAGLAVALMIGFYLLAFGLAFGLAWIPYAEWTYLHRVHPKVALACLVGAGAILWSVVPRPDRFETPGPRLMEAEQSRLFATIREIAAATNQAMPAEVYLVADVNAFVSHRGGVMGLGSHRIMGLGLPLMMTLTVDELRAVLAHEFGHYVGGDVALGPWIYKTRAALGRTIGALEESIVQAPFVAYGRTFLRLTNAVSRRQEFIADALGARVAGSQAMQSGLRKTREAAALFQQYWMGDVRVVLDAGRLPPIAAGFEAFSASRAAAAIRSAAAESNDDEQTDPYDTHPALGERLAALDAVATPGAAADSARAVTLLNDLPRLERELLAPVAAGHPGGRLRPIAWDDVGEAVYRTAWGTAVSDHATKLGTITADAIPSDEAVVASLSHVPLYVAVDLPDEVRIQAGQWLLAAALGILLAERGWRFETSPGEPVALVRGELRIEPRSIVARLVSRELDRNAWRSECVRLGIAGVPLAAGVSSANYANL